MKKRWKSFFELTVLFVLISAVFVVVCLYAISDQHLYNISNYAIAISLGFSSVCFSWSRAEVNPDVNSLILSGGRNFVSATFMLIVASILDYASYTLINFNTEFWVVVKAAFYFGYFLFLSMGIIIFFYGLHQILKSLNKIWDPKSPEDKS